MTGRQNRGNLYHNDLMCNDCNVARLFKATYCISMSKELLRAQFQLLHFRTESCRDKHYEIYPNQQRLNNFIFADAKPKNFPDTKEIPVVNEPNIQKDFVQNWKDDVFATFKTSLNVTLASLAVQASIKPLNAHRQSIVYTVLLTGINLMAVFFLLLLLFIYYRPINVSLSEKFRSFFYPRMLWKFKKINASMREPSVTHLI